MNFVEKSGQFPDARKCAVDDPCVISAPLSPELIEDGYASGFFPWGESFGHPLWYSPDPRFVLYSNELNYSKSLRPIINQRKFKVTVNVAFDRVIKSCQKIRRRGQRGSWITDETIDSFNSLHRDSKAWSVEAWEDDQLVGGLYGLLIGRVFFGESMFTTVPNASKVAFVEFVSFLRKSGVKMIDCQYHTEHLERFGAKHIVRVDFLDRLKSELQESGPVYYSGSLPPSD
jgi:leucyl/phenylalanyl-tRNA--protein transferase